MSLSRLILGTRVPLSEEVPTEFRIFKTGLNDTSQGPVLFDEQAAKDVMQHFQKEGVDGCIDLEHQSLDADHTSRVDAADSRGAYKLAVRNGELWAIDVRWAPDGERRLKEKTQRYISPVVFTNKETDRAVFVHNVALVANPATHGSQALIAASRRVPKDTVNRRVAAYYRAAKFLSKAKVK